MKYLATTALLLALTACKSVSIDPQTEALKGVLRMKLADRCMKNLPAGPVSTQYNDWDEVVEACSQQAYYQTNGCEDPALCLGALESSPEPTPSTPAKQPQRLPEKLK